MLFFLTGPWITEFIMSVRANCRRPPGECVYKQHTRAPATVICIFDDLVLPCDWPALSHARWPSLLLSFDTTIRHLNTQCRICGKRMALAVDCVWQPGIDSLCSRHTVNNCMHHLLADTGDCWCIQHVKVVHCSL